MSAATWILRPERMDGVRREVRVHHPLPHALEEEDYRFLEEQLGCEVPRIDEQHRRKCPWITVDGRVHSASAIWLKDQHQLGTPKATLDNYAGGLRLWIDFLINELGLDDRDEFKSDVMIAADKLYPHTNFVRFKTWMTSGRPKEQGGAVGISRWGQIHAAVTRFHRYLFDRWEIPEPFRTEEKVVGGHTVLSTGLGPRGSSGSAGEPLAPDFVKVLEQAALRVDGDGVRKAERTAKRDFAFIQWGLATGMRVNGLAYSTIFEVPDVSASTNGLTQVRVPDTITKGERGGRATAFDNRIAHVREYIRNTRSWTLQARRDKGWVYTPEDAIHIDTDENGQVRADMTGWWSKGEKTDWNETNDAERLRLVTPDGFPAVIWIQTTGEPLSSERAGDIVSECAKRAKKHINSDFPGVTTHDLRHTYACNLLFLTQHQMLAGLFGGSYQANNFDDALNLVAISMGHADSETTRDTYLNSFREWSLSGVTITDVLG